jgi:hypothetical protein
MFASNKRPDLLSLQISQEMTAYANANDSGDIERAQNIISTLEGNLSSYLLGYRVPAKGQAKSKLELISELAANEAQVAFMKKIEREGDSRFLGHSFEEILRNREQRIDYDDRYKLAYARLRYSYLQLIIAQYELLKEERDAIDYLGFDADNAPEDEAGELS